VFAFAGDGRPGVSDVGAGWPPITDGVVSIRPSSIGDRPALIAGRDEEFRRWLGAGSAQPSPTACIEVDGALVGWVDHDGGRPWLDEGEVNVGYSVFPAQRGRGYASRAVQLLAHHLALRTDHRRVTLLIDPSNARSLALARRLDFTSSPAREAQPDGQLLWVRPVPPRHYSDGTVTIRPLDVDDLDADLEAKDEVQIRWLWPPEHRRAWAAMSDIERRAHARRGLLDAGRSFGRGPKWRFAVDTASDRYVAYVDCDLANDRVPAGDANIAYSAHPAHRGRGHTSRAVRLVVQFLHDNTAARQAHIVVDEANVASLRVAAAVGAQEAERFRDEHGHVMIRHTVAVR
jgi:RimJ/RimL family protein N-acetyltransferase